MATATTTAGTQYAPLTPATYDDSQLVVRRSTATCFVVMLLVAFVLSLFATAVAIFALWALGAEGGRIRANHDVDIHTGDLYLEGHHALSYQDNFVPPFIFPPGNNIILGSLEGNEYASIRADLGVGIRVNEAFFNFPGFPGLVVVHTPIASIFALPVVSFFGFFSPSDQRAKHNVVDISDTEAMALLNQLRPVFFYWNQEYCDSIGLGEDECQEQQSGFIAQEVEAVLPHAVTTTNFTLGNTTYHDWHDMNNGAFIPFIVSAMQSLAARVSSLEDAAAARRK